MHQTGEGDARTICILLPYNPVVLLLQQHSKESSDRLFHSVWEETQITLMERKNEPAQVTMQIWPNATHISIKMVFGSKQAPSHLHGSEVLLHLLRDSSHEGKLREQQDFTF